MQFQNDQGRAVDPVPFLVVAASAFVVVFSFGPGYLDALSLPLDVAFAACTVVCSALVALAYHRLVWTVRPERRAILPAAVRIRRLAYAIVAGVALLSLLALPLLA